MGWQWETLRSKTLQLRQPGRWYELNIIMGRRRPKRSYPESAKDQREFEFYQANGFIEAGYSRLLYKQVEG